MFAMYARMQLVLQVLQLLSMVTKLAHPKKTIEMNESNKTLQLEITFHLHVYMFMFPVLCQ